MSKVKLLYPVASGVLSNKPVPMIDLPPVVLASDYAALEARLAEVLEWIAKWGYGDGGRECAEKAAEWLEKHGANQAGGRRP